MCGCLEFFDSTEGKSCEKSRSMLVVMQNAKKELDLFLRYEYEYEERKVWREKRHE